MNSLQHATWKKSRSCAVLLLTFCLIGASVAASAQEENTASTLLTEANVSGSLRGSFWRVDNNVAGDNDFALAEWWLKAAPRIGQDARLVLDGWVRDEGISNRVKTQGALREGYLNFSQGNADFRLGKQIIVWGRADQLNPTDNLSPRNNTLFVLESDDQRLGTVALKTSYHFPDLAVSGILLPYFQPNKQPIFGENGITFVESIPQGSQYAFKLEQAGQAVDWSVSYFQGFDLNPDMAIISIQQNALVLSLQHNKIKVLGADAATVVGRYGLRTEAAYTWTEDPSGSDPYVKNDFFYGVVGADRTFFEYLNLNLQYYVRQISNYNDPRLIANNIVAIKQAVLSSQLDYFQHGASLRMSYKWLNETLEAEVSAVASFTYRDYILRPKLSYSFDDHWKGSLGANLFQGDKDTLFGSLKDRSAIFAEMRYNY